jgi:hypothetical protein
VKTQNVAQQAWKGTVVQNLNHEISVKKPLTVVGIILKNKISFLKIFFRTSVKPVNFVGRSSSWSSSCGKNIARNNKWIRQLSYAKSHQDSESFRTSSYLLNCAWHTMQLLINPDKTTFLLVGTRSMLQNLSTQINLNFLGKTRKTSIC